MLLCLDCAAPLPPERCQAADLEIAGVRCALEAVSEAALFCDGRCRQQYFGRRSGTALRAQARARIFRTRWRLVLRTCIFAHIRVF